MVVYDVIMALVLIAAIVLGAWKGVVWQLAPIGSLVGGYFVALNYADRIAPWFGEQAPLNHYLAMFALFLAVSLAVYMVARLLRGFVESVKLTPYDRHLGALLGGVKGVLLCLCATFFLIVILPGMQETVVHSRSGYLAVLIMDRLHGIMPEQLHETLHPYMHSLDGARHGEHGEKAERALEQTQPDGPGLEQPRDLAQEIERIARKRVSDTVGKRIEQWTNPEGGKGSPAQDSEQVFERILDRAGMKKAAGG